MNPVTCDEHTQKFELPPVQAKKIYFIGDPGIHELEREIDIGMKSPVSPRSHKEIFNNLKEKYEPR